MARWPFRRRSRAAAEATTNIQGYRNALAAAVYDLSAAEQRIRDTLRAEHSHPWLAGYQVQIQLLALWIVHTCHWVSGRMTEAAAATGAGPADDVLPAEIIPTATHVVQLGLVWAARASSALNTPGYRLDSALPVPLLATSTPPGQLIRHRPAPDLAPPTPAQLAMAVALVGELREQAALLTGEINSPGYTLPREFDSWRATFAQRQGELAARATSAERLARSGLVGSSLVGLHQELSTLAEEYFQFGQEIILPAILSRDFTLRPDRPARTGAQPQEPHQLRALRTWLGFDPWLLTAPEMRGPDPGRLTELDHFWLDDPDPAATRAVAGRLAEHVAAGRVRRRPAQDALLACPWSPVYEAVETIELGERIGAGSYFALQPRLVDGCFEHAIRRFGAALRPGPTPDPTVDRGIGRELPGQPSGVDLWRLTDPEARDQLADDPAARAELTRLWAGDDDPARTERLVRALRTAEAAGDIRRRPRMYLRQCPWPTTWVAVRSIDVGERIGAGTVFALTVARTPEGFIRSVRRV